MNARTASVPPSGLRQFAPRPGPREWAAPLFALAVIIFWLCMIQSSMLPSHRDRRQTLHWPPGAADSVRRVIIESPLGNTWNSVDLHWYKGPPQLEVMYGSLQSPPLQLVHEGDTLYVRQPPPPVDAGKDRTHIEKIWLPLQVEMVQGRSLTVVQRQSPLQEDSAVIPPRLELRAQEVFVRRCCGAAVAEGRPQPVDIGDLHIIGLAPPNDEASQCMPLNRIEIDVDAEKIARLHVEALGGDLKLKNIKPDAIQIRTPPGISMYLDDISHLQNLDWQPLPPSRITQIGQMLPTHQTQKAYCE